MIVASDFTGGALTPCAFISAMLPTSTFLPHTVTSMPRPGILFGRFMSEAGGSFVQAAFNACAIGWLKLLSAAAASVSRSSAEMPTGST